MHRWLQSLIVCLLALALPGQGVAAATMIHCAQAHQRLQSAAGHPDAQASAGHGHAAPHTHSSHTHAAAHTRDPAHTHDAAQAHDAVHTHDAAQANPADHGVSSDFGSAQAEAAAEVGPYACSACASCCSGVGLSSALLQVPQPDAAATVFVTVVPAVDVFATDGPDRPPRIVLA